MAAKIGDVGRAACPLYPSGRVLIDKAPMAARAEKGPIEQGTEIVVVGGDRFCLIVRPIDPSSPSSLLPNFGMPVLTAKEDAARQAELIQKERQQDREEHRRLFFKLLLMAAGSGLLIGSGLMAIQTVRAGYSNDLIWVPPLSALCWVGLIALTFYLGMETENLLAFISIPCALCGLIVVMVFFGPILAIGFCFVIGVGVTLVSFLIEALRQPVK